MIGQARAFMADRGSWQPLLSRAMPLMVITFCQATAFAIIFFAVNQSYFVEGLGLGIAFPGYLITSLSLSKLAAQVPAGWLVDRLPRRTSLVAGLAGKAAVLTALFLVQEPSLLLALVALFGVAMALTSPALYAIAGDTFPVAGRGKAMALLDGSYMLGLAAGGMGGALLVDLLPYAAAFAVAMALSGAALAVAAAAIGRPASHPGRPGAVRRPGLGRLGRLLSRDILIMVVIVLLIALGSNLLAPIFRPYGKEVLGLELHQLSLFLALPAGLAALSLLPAGHLADRWGRLPALGLGLTMVPLGLLAVTQTSNPWLVMLWATPTVIGFVIALPAWSAAALDLTRPDNRGTIWGLLVMVQGIGGAVGPAVGGRWAEAYGPLAAIRLAALLLALAALVSWAYLLMRRGQPQPLPEPAGDPLAE